MLMTNSICTTVVEVKKDISYSYNTFIMPSWQPRSKPTTWHFNV